MVKRLNRSVWVLALAVMVVGSLGGVAPRYSALRAAYAQDGVSEENCAVTPFDIAGQGNYSVAGVPDEELPPSVRSDQIIEVTDSALHAVSAVGSQPVAILVIDDFFEYNGEVPHGRLVTDLLKGMIQANPTYAFEPSQPVRFPYVWVWEPSEGGTLLLVEVDIENDDTGDLRDRIERTVTTIQREFDVNRVVLNMSFVLVPCVTPDYDVIALREARVKGETGHVPLLAEIARSRNVAIDLDRAAVDVLEQPLHDDMAYRAVTVILANYALRLAQPDPGADPDPLHDYIQSLTGQGTNWNSGADPLIFAVGAAGDMERRVASFAPAAWAEVASVSASMGSGAPWRSSNQGQVMLPGGLFPVDDVYLIGTSFSAPVLSMNMAFYLTHDSVCTEPPLDLAVPRFMDDPLERVVNRQCKPPFAPITR